VFFHAPYSMMLTYDRVGRAQMVSWTSTYDFELGAKLFFTIVDASGEELNTAPVEYLYDVGTAIQNYPSSSSLNVLQPTSITTLLLESSTAIGASGLTSMSTLTTSSITSKNYVAATNSAAPNEGSNKQHANAVSAGTIAGITMGGIAVSLLAVIAALLWRRKKQRQQTSSWQHSEQAFAEKAPNNGLGERSHSQLDGRPISYELHGQSNQEIPNERN
jgi:hypothetical protein